MATRNDREDMTIGGMGTQEWSEFGAFATWASKCKVTALHGSPVI
jgi:hypothetical protein